MQYPNKSAFIGQVRSTPEGYHYFGSAVGDDLQRVKDVRLARILVETWVCHHADWQAGDTFDCTVFGKEPEQGASAPAKESKLTAQEIETFESFCVLMRQKLEDNAYKGGWLTDDRHYLLGRATAELGELAEEVNKPVTDADATVYEAADVALMVMMVADVTTRRRYPGNRISYLASLFARGILTTTKLGVQYFVNFGVFLKKGNQRHE